MIYLSMDQLSAYIDLDLNYGQYSLIILNELGQLVGIGGIKGEMVRWEDVINLYF